MATSTSSTESPSSPNDAVKAFFSSMPPPEDHYTKPFNEIQPTLVNAMVNFMFTPIPRHRTMDHDFRLIQQANEDSMADPKGGAVVYEQLAKLALSTVNDPHDHSAMAKQLRYIRWVVTGMKDETTPFSSTTVSHSSARPISHCAACGNAEASMRCSGCELPADTGNPFATVYCNHKCQKKDWKTHKAICKQIQQLMRAVDMFNVIFRHRLAMTFPSGYTITSITIDQGMTVARTQSNGAYTRPRLQSTASETKVEGWNVISIQSTGGFADASAAAAWCPFPTAVASSPDLATAVMLNAQCNTPLTEARALFEMLIRRKSCLAVLNHVCKAI